MQARTPHSAIGARLLCYGTRAGKTCREATDRGIACLMRSRKIGTTKVEASEIALGTWGLAANTYGEVTPSEYDAVVKAAWDAGIRAYDLSPT